MTAIVIDGNAIAAAVRREWKGRAEALKRRGVLPALAVVIVGDNLASKIYVRNKVKAYREVGLHSEVHELPADIGEDMVLAHIRLLNHNPDIHGILVQLPLPPQLDRDKVLATVSADKDSIWLKAFPTPDPVAKEQVPNEADVRRELAWGVPSAELAQRAELLTTESMI